MRRIDTKKTMSEQYAIGFVFKISIIVSDGIFEVISMGSRRSRDGLIFQRIHHTVEIPPTPREARGEESS